MSSRRKSSNSYSLSLGVSKLTQGIYVWPSEYLVSEDGVARYVDPCGDGDRHHLPVTRDYQVSPAEDCVSKVTV